MIILDTNIISEIMRQLPNEKVLAWLDKQEATDLFITAITIAEISYGLHVLPEGNRRSALEGSFNKAINEAFNNRVLTFDKAAGYHYGEIMSYRKSLGRPLGVCDGQIAAIARIHGFSLTTRNIKDFSDCHLELINPFE